MSKIDEVRKAKVEAMKAKDKETNGKESFYARNQVNPNLTILLRKEYYDNNMKLLKKEEIINDDWYFEY